MSRRRERVRSSQACESCSSKKIKCGGQKPQCRTCLAYSRDCIYGISKRNTRLNQSVQNEFEFDNSSPQAGFTNEDDSSGQYLSGFNKNDALNTPGQEQTLSVLPEESVHLFRTYFTHIHQIWPLLYKPLYDPIDYQQLATELPKSLAFSIYAIASCIRSETRDFELSGHSKLQSKEVDPISKANQFFDAALAELQRSRENSDYFSLATAIKPSIPNCQALTILALQQHGVAEFSRAGILCALASAMAIDLRIHRDCWSHDLVEKEIASRLWWNVFVLDKMLAAETGRPVILRSEETDSPYPSVQESDEFELFNLNHRWENLAEGSSPFVKMRTISAFHTTIEVVKLMEQVQQKIYSLKSRASIRQDRAGGDALRMILSAEIAMWETNVEASPLRLDMSPSLSSLPVMVTNYVGIKSTIIMLHRPFISYWKRYKEAANCAPFNTPDPEQSCLEAAKDICLILDKYSEYLPRLPSDLIYMVFTTAGVLLAHSKDLPPTSTELAETLFSLQKCVNWLSVFGKNWKNAAARQTLLNDWYELPANLSHAGGSETPKAIFNPYNQSGPVDSTSSLLFDGDQFAEILNAVEDWGFSFDLETPGFDDDMLH